MFGGGRDEGFPAGEEMGGGVGCVDRRWQRQPGGWGRKGTATTMGAGGCSMGVKRSPEVGDGGGDRLIWTASG